MPQMRGAIPTPRHRLAAATPFRIVGPTPDRHLIVPQKLSVWLNDTYGDCVTAEEAFAKACSGIFVSDSEVKRWASQHGVLNGAMLDEVLDWMAASGFSQDGNTYNDGGKVSVDYTNPDAMANALFQGPVKLGVAAGQLNIGNHNGWFLNGLRRDGNEDHSTAACGYGPVGWLLQQLGGTLPSGYDGNKPGYAFFTWGTIGVMDAQSLVNITGEAWLRVPTTQTVGTNSPTADPVVILPPPGPPTPIPPVPGPAILSLDFSQHGYRAGDFVPGFTTSVDIPPKRYNLVPLS